MEEKKDIKDPKTVIELIDILKARNIIIKDNDFANNILNKINYYRLSAYMLTHKNLDGTYSNITIEEVYNLYLFDKSLRNLILPVLENIEIAFRTHISYHIAHQYGALGYKNPAKFKNASYHKEMVTSLEREMARSDEIFISHHKEAYNGVFPIWVLIEVTSFGTLSKMYSNMLDEDQDEIAEKYYGTKGEFVRTWLYSLSNIRNRCAHYGRLYNNNLKITPKLYKSDYKKGLANDTIFANLCIMGRLARDKAEWDNFVTNLSALIEGFDVVDLKYLGFLEEWETLLRNIAVN